ncbi:serine hydrolase [Amycolatopsis sp. NBC_01307]|uniref:serine hydrolase n=1 Tax=Amycolatopsis sp. NBC_01307 TaxID=2903561 RepID=UPI002E116620|nr:serine hydrolase [Amycolatopsis sp. NBC_01307]
MTALQKVTNTLESLPTTAFLVLDQGRTVLDHGTTTTPSFLASARKSVLSVLYGPAVADGTIRLEATLDELGIDDIGGLLPEERRATVRDLLTSRSGVYHPATAAAGPEDDAPARGTQPPGTLFLYNNWDFNTLGTIFERCTGRPISPRWPKTWRHRSVSRTSTRLVSGCSAAPTSLSTSRTTSSSPPATSAGSARCCCSRAGGTTGKSSPHPG